MPPPSFCIEQVARERHRLARCHHSIMRQRLEPQAMREERGLLETTTVIAWGEFGRTPKINAKGGRDHWPGTQSVLLAGGGIQGGRVIGETDNIGSVPASRPVHVQEIFATLYNNLGIDVNSDTVNDFNGRPRFLVTGGSQPIPELY